MDKERIDNYNDKVSEWVSKQGILFELVHATKLLGTPGGAFKQLFSIFYKVLILLVVLAIVAFCFAATWQTQPKFQKKIKNSIAYSMKANEVKLRKIKNDALGNTEIGGLKMVGSNISFIDTMDITKITFKGGNFLGLKKKWHPRILRISNIDAKIKTGADKAEISNQLFKPLFSTKNDWFDVNILEVNSFSLEWGYGKQSKGNIKNASLDLVKNGDNISFEITGGTLNYAWIKDADIISLKATATPNSLEITEVILQQASGKVSFDLKLVESGVLPRFEGEGSFSSINVDSFLKQDYLKLLDGFVSGNFTLDGSFNSPFGLNYEVQSKMLDNDYIEIGSKFSLLQAFATLDGTVDYKDLRFSDYQWTVSKVDDEIFIKDLRLSLQDAITIKANLELDRPKEDLNKTFATLDYLDRTSLFQDDSERVKNLNYLDKKENSAVQGGAALVEKIKGSFSIALSRDTFREHKALRLYYPVDEETNTRLIKFDVDEPFKDLTKEFSQKFYSFALQKK